MLARLIKVVETIIAAIARLLRWWFRQIGQQTTLRAKAVVACAGLLALCVVCSFPVALINGPRQSAPAAAVAPSARSTTIVADAPTALLTTLPTRVPPTIAPTDVPPTSTPRPSPTPEPPTATPEPTAVPTDPPTRVPTAKPKPTAKPAAKPTAVPKPVAAPATSRFYTNGTDRYNCDDFATYAEAYAVYKANLPGDPNKLDRDKDGIPCESLPGAP